MNKIKLFSRLSILLLCLALCGCGSAAREQPDAIQLWYVEGDPAAPAVYALLREYNEQLSSRASPVQLRILPSEESLAGLQPGALPDLLLCSQAAACRLAEQGLLQDLSGELNRAAPDYGALSRQSEAALGKGCYPLGASVPLLCIRPETVRAPLKLETVFTQAAVYGQKTGLPYCSADEFAPLFAQLLRQRGAPFHAVEKLDSENEAYEEVYNLLAMAAFRRGLVSRYVSAARLVQAGQLPCAIVSSSRLPRLELSACQLLPLPGSQGSEDCPAQLRCLAVTAQDKHALQDIGAFLRWLLEEERLRDLALQSGLVPVHACAAPEAGPLTTPLWEVSTSRSLFFPDVNPDYRDNAAEFEARFRAALERLA